MMFNKSRVKAMTFVNYSNSSIAFDITLSILSNMIMTDLHIFYFYFRII